MPLHQPLTLRHNFSWTLFGNGVYAATQWGTLVVLAKLGTASMVGEFTLGLAIAAPIFMLTNLQLRAIQATDARHHYQFNDYFGLRLAGTGLAIGIILIITLVGYRRETGLIVLVIGISKAIESISDVFYGLLQQYERMDRIAISLMLRGCSSFVSMSLGLYLTHQIIWGIVGLTLAWTVVLVGYDLRSGALLLRGQMAASAPLLNPLKPQWQWLKLTKLVRVALPMGLVMMLISLNTDIPRYLIEGYLGTQELGIFAAIAYLIMVGGTIVGALGQAAVPRLAKHYASGDRHAFRDLLFRLVGVGAGLGAIAIVVALIAGPQVLTLLYQPEYAQYNSLFVWLMVAGGISYTASFLGYGMTAAQYFSIQLPLFMGVTAVSALFCFWLIPVLGLTGAAFALILSSLVQVAISSGVISYAIHRLPSVKDINILDAR